MRAVLISNPTASRVTDARLRVVEHALAATFDLDVVSTLDRHHAAELARSAVQRGAEAVIVYGGDGTVNEAVNGMIGADQRTDAVLGLLPGGGTNVLARSLGYPKDLVEATGHLLEIAEAQKVRRLSIGRLRTDHHDRVFTFSCGLGLDGDTVRRVEASGLRPRLGDAAFCYAFARSYFALRKGDEPAITLATPDGDIDVWWVMTSVSDPLTYLGSRPLRVAPDAHHDRGLHVAAGRTVSLWRTMRWVGQALTTAKQVKHRDYVYLRDRTSISATADVPAPLQADGEYLGAVRRLDAISLPDALPVFA